MFETADHVGGHAHTHAYPQFVALLDELGVESQASEMSFSVRCAASGLEYNGATLNSLFAQRRNLLRPYFWRMIKDILRFNRQAPLLLQMSGSEVSMAKLTASYRNRIRSGTPIESVRRTATAVVVKARGHEPVFYDRVFLACHSDQALRLLGDADPQERATLSAIQYQSNGVALHIDTTVLPRRKLAWAAWNYRLPEREGDRVAVTYNMNLLQRLGTRTPLLVSLNMTDAIDPAKIIKHLCLRVSDLQPGGSAGSVETCRSQRRKSDLLLRRLLAIWFSRRWRRQRPGCTRALQAA